jgi:hypothetical protein
MNIIKIFNNNDPKILLESDEKLKAEVIKLIKLASLKDIKKILEYCMTLNDESAIYLGALILKNYGEIITEEKIITEETIAELKEEIGNIEDTEDIEWFTIGDEYTETIFDDKYDELLTCAQYLKFVKKYKNKIMEMYE